MEEKRLKQWFKTKSRREKWLHDL